MALRLSDADRAAWADYEARNKAAAEQYERMPVSWWCSGPASPCRTCGKRTRARGLICRACRP